MDGGKSYLYPNPSPWWGGGGGTFSMAWNVDHRPVPLLKSSLLLRAFHITFITFARDTGVALRRFKNVFVLLDHSTPVEPPSQQAATIADSDMNQTVSVRYGAFTIKATSPNHVVNRHKFCVHPRTSLVLHKCARTYTLVTKRAITTFRIQPL